MKEVIECQKRIIEDILSGDLPFIEAVQAARHYVQFELLLYPKEYHKEKTS